MVHAIENRDYSRALLVRAGYDCASFDGAGASGMNAKRRRGEPARGAALIGASLAFALAPALLARVGGWRERRRRAMACVALLAVLCSAGSALAQQCTPTGTNQTCTNSISLPGSWEGRYRSPPRPKSLREIMEGKRKQ